MTLIEISQTGEFVSQTAGMSYKFTKDILKMIRPFFQLFVTFILLDYFLFLWNNTAWLASWRANGTAQQIKYTLDYFFGSANNDTGRTVILMLLYACVTYVSSRMYGKSVLSLAGPVTLALAAGALMLVLRLVGEYNAGDNNPSGSCGESSALGCQSWTWLSDWTGEILGANNQTAILLGMIAGFLTSRIQLAM